MLKRRFFVLILNTIQKEYRNKTLIFLFIFTIGIIFLLNLIDDYLTGNFGSLGHGFSATAALPLSLNKVSLFYSIIASWSTFLSVLLGVQTIRSDLSSNILPQLLSFPIPREIYLAARIIGLWIVVILYYVISLICAILVFKTSQGDFQIAWSVFHSLTINSFVLLAVLTLTIFYSLFFSKILSFVFVFFHLLIISLSNSFFKHPENIIFDNPNLLLKITGYGFHNLFPRTGILKDLAGNLLSREISPYNIPWEISHFLLTYIFIFFIMSLIFKRKSF